MGETGGEKDGGIGVGSDWEILTGDINTSVCI